MSQPGQEPKNAPPSRPPQPPLRALMVEDSEDDALLSMREFRKEGIAVEWRRVETRAGMEQALGEGGWDLVICDHILPAFSSAGALDVMRKWSLDMPFIIVSGAAPEDVVTAAMRQGAHDFISKDNLVRLVPAVRRELKEAALRRDRRGMESRLQASETLRTLLSATVEQVADAIAITDPEGTVTYANRAFEALAGGVTGPCQGRPLAKLLVGAGLAPILAQATGGQAWEGRVGLDLRGKGARDLDLSCSPVRDDAQEVRHLVTVLRDVTKEVELERQLRQAQKMDALGVMAAGIAHDFNNTLAAILASAEVLQLRLAEDSPLLPRVETILNAGRNAMGLTRQVLAFSHKADERRIPLDFTTLVREALSTLRSTLPANVDLVHELTSGIWAEGDPALYQQMVLNLCINAVQAMQPQGGVLLVRLTEPAEAPSAPGAGRRMLLTVRDTGCGMDAQVQERIFEPFFTTKPSGEGTGLGLAMVHATVKKAGGTIAVQSAPGQGASFVIQLPCAAGSPAPAREAPARGPRPAPPSLAGTRPSILLVEDSHVTCSMMRTWLEGAGYQVTDAGDGLTAWEVFTAAPRDRRFDLLLTDVVMPRMDGLELVQLVRKEDPAIPIGVLTSNEDKETIKAALHLGVDEFLNKPFKRGDLLESVAKLLAERTSRLAARRSVETAQEVRQAQRSMAAAPEQGVPLYTLYEPRTDAGGDLFRCFKGADGTVLFVVADVAGHSVLSSYAVASFLGMLSAQAAACLELAARTRGGDGEDPLARLARQLNQGIQDGPFAEVPVCVLLGLWSQADGQVQLLNAGIPHGLHLRRSQGRSVPIPLNGTPLGVFPEPELEGAVLQLGAGDRLLFGTDGFFEAQSAARAWFQESAGRHWESLAASPLDWALSAICEAARSHTGGSLADDLLVVGFEQPGRPPEPGVLTLRIPSTTGAVDLACDRLRELLRDLPAARRFDVVLAVREALTNAVLHGNQGRADASVLVGCRFEPGRRELVVSVADEGPGFDLATLQPPQDPLSERGRGLPLIRFHAQQVQAEGGTLTMTFHLEECDHDDR